MAQTYELLQSGVTTFGELYGKINNLVEALRSCFSGENFPTNPVAGQLCWRTDRKKWYIYVNDTSIGENGWVEIAIASAGLGAEIINARGSKSSLDERLDVSLNEDGTLKANVAAYQSEWIKPSLTFTYVDSTSFKVEGNQTDIYAPYRRLKINHSTSATGYTHVVSATYDDTNDETTVTVADAVIQSDLVSVEHSIIHSDRNKDSLPRNILDKATYDSDYDGKVENADYADSAGNADTVDSKHASDFLPVSTDSAISASISGNQWLSVATSGIISLPKQSFCFMYQNTQQTIPSDTDTKVVLDAKGADIQNEGDTTNYRITVNEAGVYLIIGQIGWYGSDVVAGKNIATVIRVNGSNITWKGMQTANTGGGIDNSVAVIQQLTAGDYVELWAKQYTDSNMRTIAALAHTFLCVAKIA